MRLSSGLVLQLTNSLLAAAAAYTAGSLGGEMLHRRILKTPLPVETQAAPPAEKHVAGENRPSRDFAVILDRNVFHAQKTEVAKPPPPPEPQPETPAEKPAEQLEPTKLQIALTGTMVYGTDISFAFVSSRKRMTEYTVYQIGECFHPKTVRRDRECAEDSVKVLEIDDRRIVIVHLGVKQILWMEEAKGFTVEETTAPAAPLRKSTALVIPPAEQKKDQKKRGKSTQEVKSKRDPGVSREGQTTYHFERIWVDEQLEDFEQLLMDARVVPTKKDGKSLFMFQFIKDESIYRKLGLKSKDIILEINGFVVDSVAKALKLLEALQSEREIALKVERDGAPLEFMYYID